MPLLGLHLGAGTMAGQKLGAERLDRVRASCRAAVLTGLSITAVLEALAWVFAVPSPRLFTADPAIVGLGVPLAFLVSSLAACAFEAQVRAATSRRAQ